MKAIFVFRPQPSIVEKNRSFAVKNSNRSHILRRQRSQTHRFPGPSLYQSCLRRQESFSISCLQENQREISEATIVELASPVSHPWWFSPYDIQILKFAIPTLLANLIVPISTAVDTGSSFLASQTFEIEI